MKLFNRFFGKKTSDANENIIELSQFIGSLIDKTVNNIFKEYHDIFINEDITYIVFAVWGARKDGNLTPLQIEINNKIVPVIQQITESFQIKNINDSQSYAIGFLVRGIIISKITYLIELLKNKMSNIDTKTEQSQDISNFLASLGNDNENDRINLDDSTWFKRFGDDGFKRW